MIVREKSFYKDLLLLSAPIAAQNVITYLVGLADNIMVSKLGETAVSGVFVANQITTLLQMFVTGVAAAVTVLAAQYWGKNDTESMRSIVSVAFKLCVGASLLLWMGLFFFSGNVLSLLTNEPEVIAEGTKYVRIICFTYLPFCLSNLLVASMRCVERARIGTVTAFAALVINLFLNWVFIFGNLGAPRLGIKGAAIATLAARLAELMIMIFYVMRIDKRLCLKISGLFRFGSPFVKDFLKYGSPVIAGDLLWGMNIAAQGAIIGHLGTAAIAAVSIANTMFAIISVWSYGLRDGTSIIIGKTVGTGDIEKVKEYSKTLQLIFVGVGLLTGLLIFMSRFAVPYIYDSMDDETIRISKQFLFVLSVSIVGTSYQMASLTGIVRAGGATKFVFINDAIFVWLLVIPSAMIAAFVFDASPWIVFAFLKSDQILKCIVAVIKVNKFNWIKNLTDDRASEKIRDNK